MAGGDAEHRGKETNEGGGTMDYWNLGYLALHAVVFVLTCLTLGIALSRARVHAAWLLPACLGQGLSLCTSLLFLAYSVSIRSSGYRASMNWFFIPQQILSGLAMLCAVWAAVALYQTMRTLTAGSLAAGRGQYPASGGDDKETWPPPPRQ